MKNLEIRRTARFKLAGLVLIAPIYAQTPAPLPPLQNTHRMVFKGIVKPAEPAAQGVSPATGLAITTSVPELCNFEMALKPGQNHVEARLIGAVRKNGNSACEADFNVGIPTVIQPPPQAFGAPTFYDSSPTPTTSIASTTSTVMVGRDNGNLPDFTEIFAKQDGIVAKSGSEGLHW